MAVPDLTGGRRAVQFFQRLSAALQTSKVPRLAAALHMFLESLDALFDLAFQDLLLALAALTSSRTELANLPHGTRAKRFLEAHGVVLPEELAQNIDGVERGLHTRGLVLPDTRTISGSAPDESSG